MGSVNSRIYLMMNVLITVAVAVALAAAEALRVRAERIRSSRTHVSWARNLAGILLDIPVFRCWRSASATG